MIFFSVILLKDKVSGIRHFPVISLCVCKSPFGISEMVSETCKAVDLVSVSLFMDITDTKHCLWFCFSPCPLEQHENSWVFFSLIPRSTYGTKYTESVE